jgi:ketosteroid isomerase-like protein
MSQENVRIENPVIRRWLWAFENDSSAFEAILHPEIEWFPIDENYGRLHGIEAAVRNRNEWLDAWAEHRFDVDEVAAAGNSVVVLVHITARGKTSGAEVDVRFYAHVKLRDNKVVYIHDYEDRAEALEAIGLSEQAASRTNPENVELACSYFEEIARASRDNFDIETTISKMAEYWDPEIEWDTRGGPVQDIAGVYRGIAGASQWCREWFEAWEALHFEYEVVEAGERVVVTLPDLRLRGRSSGIEVAMGKHAWVIRFRDGLIVHHKLYPSHSEALGTVGMSEQDAYADS